MTTAASSGGVSRRRALMGSGFWFVCAAITCCGERPEKGGWPHNISYVTTPSA